MHLPSNFMDSGEAAAGNSGQALLVLKDVRRNAGPGRPTTTLSQPLLGSVHGLLNGHAGHQPLFPDAPCLSNTPSPCSALKQRPPRANFCR